MATNEAMENDNSLLYACWINDITLIKERLVGVKASHLKKTTMELGTPLHVASNHENYEVVDLLIDAGANLEQGNLISDTPLYACIKEGKLKMARHLVERGANINKRGGGALYELVERSWDKEFAQYLLDKGALISATGTLKETLLDVAARKNHLEAIILFIENGIDTSNMDKVVSQGIAFNALEVVQYLLEHYVDFSKLNEGAKGFRRELYHMTLGNGNYGDRTPMINFLLNLGVDFKAKPIKGVPSGGLGAKTKDSPYEYAQNLLRSYPNIPHIKNHLEAVDRYILNNKQ